MSDSNEKILELKADFYAGVDDFTFFHPTGKLGDFFQKEPTPVQKEELLSGPPWDGTARFKGNNSELEGRLHVSRCYDGKYLSCSFRANPEQKSIAGLNDYHPAFYDITKSKYKPDPEKNKRYLTSMQTLCNSIGDQVFDNSDARGLIIVSGATAAGKSQIARGLIYYYLKGRVNTRNKRRPHLVTYENPIDVRWADGPEQARMTGIDYTPCAVEDAKSLRCALAAALRQTPDLFFVGETRSPADWKKLVHFASTGHLVVTTSHAGSLTETMGQLIRTTKADSPALRSEIAKRLLAVVHLRADKATDDSKVTLSYTVPAVWTQTTSSTKTFMSDGLTSLLPYRDKNSDKKNSPGCLGRTYFAEQLLKEGNFEGMNEEVKKRISKKIHETALQWDLEGV